MFKNVKNKAFGKASLILILLIVLEIVLGNIFYKPCNDKIRKDEILDLSYSDFTELLNDKQINIVYFGATSDNLYINTVDDKYYTVNNPNYENFKKDLLEQGVIVKKIVDLQTANEVEDSRVAHITLLAFALISILIYCLYKTYTESSDSEGKMVVIKNKKKKVPLSQNGDAVEVGANKQISNKDVGVKSFSDIAGLTEVKRDMQCVVDFLINKDKYLEAGAQLPKGIILYGPPGTGKTLLAKAVACEADVPFIYMSGSEFIEMYVGVGAKRVRELFAKARKQAPCIVFIDEIDAIGGKRTGHDNGEDRKTINALLTEMDGFKETENIIVIAATNRLEDLDPALLRPGRFTNHYCVPLPETVADRLEVINLYIKNKHIDDAVDLKALAKETVGFSPAKIEALLNEASIISVQDGSSVITKEIIDKAMYKILLQGHAKDDMAERDKEELELIAWHEAGHALVGHLFGKDITKVTIVPSTSGAGGVTFSTPTKTHLLSASDLEHEIMELYGGRVAELIYFKDDKTKVTTGASNDIERATEFIHNYVTKYGMSETFGLLNLERADVSIDTIVQSEIEIAKMLETKTYEMLKKYIDKLTTMANLLIENETIYHADIVSIFEK